MSKQKMVEFKLECHQQYDLNEQSQRIVGKGRVRHLINHTTLIFVMKLTLCDEYIRMLTIQLNPWAWVRGYLFSQTKVFDLQEIQFPTVIMLNTYVGHLSSPLDS